MATLGLSKVFILDKYFTELQKFWDTERKLQGEEDNLSRYLNPNPNINLNRNLNLNLDLKFNPKIDPNNKSYNNPSNVVACFY